MNTFSLHRGLAATALAAAACLGAGTAHAQTAAGRLTLDAGARQNALSDGYPNGHAGTVGLVWDRPNGDTLRGELMHERKFGSTGTVGTAAYTWAIGQRWLLTPTLALASGDRNWAKGRLDVELGAKFGPGQMFVGRVAAFSAVYDQQADITEGGLRLGIAAYLPDDLVAEAGLRRTTTQPGGITSTMPFIALTRGSEGSHYLALRVSHGSEGWLDTGTSAVPVRYTSTTAALSGRVWLGSGWGLSGQFEHYRNPYYTRRTLGAGGFVQW